MDGDKVTGQATRGSIDYSGMRLEILRIITRWHVDYGSDQPILEIADEAFRWATTGIVPQNNNEGNK